MASSISARGFSADAGQLRLRLGELPVRGDEAAVFVRIGITDHHLLHAALPVRGAADERDGERLAHDGGRGPEIGDGLEQGHDGHGANLSAGGIEEEAAFFSKQIGAENVVDRARHREDEGAERVAVDPAPHVSRLAEHGDQLGGVGREVGHESRRGERARELAQQPDAPFAAADLRRRRLAVAGRRPPQGLQRRRGARGVLAEVEPHR